jgi:hypothetical protein
MVVVIAGALALSGCAVVGAVSAVATVDKFKKCVADYKATPEAKMLSARMWQGDDTDTAGKLSDPNPLTPQERDALVKLHPKIQECRQIIIAHDNVFAAWEAQHWQAYFQREDQVFYKLASGELPVGVANKLSIDSWNELKVEGSKGQADEVRFQQAQAAQRAAAAAQASAAMAASQPRMTTTNCTWIGNSISCTGMH